LVNQGVYLRVLPLELRLAHFLQLLDIGLLELFYVIHRGKAPGQRLKPRGNQPVGNRQFFCAVAKEYRK
jgi:hypothetical protein